MNKKQSDIYAWKINGINFVILDNLKKEYIIFSHETLLFSYAAVADVTGEYFHKDSKLYLLLYSIQFNIYLQNLHFTTQAS